jgi:uncharacterized Fe-S cluster protein YjdI
METEPRHRPEVLRDYEGEGIIVHWEPKLCIHAANCIRQLPGVFDPNARPWVTVDTASADDISAAIQSCPTGALRYQRTDGTPQEVPDVPTTIQYLRNGPMIVPGCLRQAAACPRARRSARDVAGAILRPRVRRHGGRTAA